MNFNFWFTFAPRRRNFSIWRPHSALRNMYSNTLNKPTVSVSYSIYIPQIFPQTKEKLLGIKCEMENLKHKITHATDGILNGWRRLKFKFISATADSKLIWILNLYTLLINYFNFGNYCAMKSKWLFFFIILERFVYILIHCAIPHEFYMQSRWNSWIIFQLHIQRKCDREWSDLKMHFAHSANWSNKHI